MITDLALASDGSIVYLDADGHRDFSPRTRHAMQLAAAAVVSAVVSAVVLLALLIGTGLMPPLPWSPMGQVIPGNAPRVPAPTPAPPLTENATAARK